MRVSGIKDNVMVYLIVYVCTVVNLSLERRSYDVIESQSSVEICVVLTGGILSTPMNINIFDAQGTATYPCKSQLYV